VLLNQVVRKLREADRLLADGKDVAQIAKHLEISEQTYHRWRKQYGLKANDAKRHRELAKENTRLKRIVADKDLEIDALKGAGLPSLPATAMRGQREIGERVSLARPDHEEARPELSHTVVGCIENSPLELVTGRVDLLEQSPESRSAQR